ncbi:hypothetical protein [Alicyclobacillus fastidiosus]|uniref:hypothetical protein n=1 Tax=Alicyclobacillus fastidiosus TaxID=392011 RepID=UPI0034DDABD0
MSVSAYVTNSEGNTVSRIDVKTNRVVATIPVGNSKHTRSICAFSIISSGFDVITECTGMLSHQPVLR